MSENPLSVSEEPGKNIQSPEEKDLPRQKRGAPLGNQNALRHGFYAKNLGIISPKQYSESEMRNLLGEAAMLKDFMFKLYNANFESTDNTTIIETIRALSLAGMALSRVLQVHVHIRVWDGNDDDDEPLKDILSSLDSATKRISHLDL
jgi:hypothetical protein